MSRFQMEQEFWVKQRIRDARGHMSRAPKLLRNQRGYHASVGIALTSLPPLPEGEEAINLSVSTILQADSIEIKSLLFGQLACIKRQ